MQITIDVSPDSEVKLRELVQAWTVENTSTALSVEASIQCAVGINMSYADLMKRKAAKKVPFAP